jgi:MoaA/NifB/PqqE/SkfB family radical SAM enzyme
MSSNNILDNTRMYRLPYSKNDNPNGWIEVTTHCNMKCAGCYKGIDRDDSLIMHEPLEKIKADILELKRIRNCAIITISGGEALMHPRIEDIVTFVKANGMHPFIHTNGILIREEMAGKLKKAGLTGFIVRVDILNRPEAQHETDLNHLRSEIANLVKKTGGLQLGFTCVVTKKNLRQIPLVVNWFREHNHLTDYLVLILKREYCFREEEKIDFSEEVQVEEIVRELKNHTPEMIFSSYLGDQEKNIGFKWVQSAWIANEGKVLGYADPKMVELSTMLAHFRNRNYSYVAGKERNTISLGQMIMGSFMIPSMRLVLWRFLKAIFSHPLKKANHQVVNIVDPPGHSPGNEGFCDACPDAILHEGVLQPSCVLESIKSIKKEK